MGNNLFTAEITVKEAAGIMTDHAEDIKTYAQSIGTAASMLRDHPDDGSVKLYAERIGRYIGEIQKISSRISSILESLEQRKKGKK